MRRVQASPELWRYICCEAFVAPDRPAYWEYNISPSRAWDAAAFTSYREGGRIERAELTPNIDVHRADERLNVNAIIDLARCDPRLAADPLRVGLAVVLDDRQGELSYWALAHPAKRPDFHQAESFALGFGALS